MARITMRTFEPDPDNAHDPEVQALFRLIDAFALEMKGKLLNKFRDGWRGWDIMAPVDAEQALRMQLVKKPMDPVDIANFCAFLFNAEGR